MQLGSSEQRAGRAAQNHPEGAGEAWGEPHGYCALRAISISRMLSSASFTLRSRYDFFCCKAEIPEES